MNAIIIVQNPLSNIESIRVYPPIKGEANSLIYPVKINDILTNIRISKNAMWVEKTFADTFSDETLNFVGNLINSKN